MLGTRQGLPENPRFQKQEMDFLGLSFLLSFSQVLSRSPSIRKRKEDEGGEERTGINPEKELIQMVTLQEFLSGESSNMMMDN